MGFSPRNLIASLLGATQQQSEQNICQAVRVALGLFGIQAAAVTFDTDARCVRILAKQHGQPVSRDIPFAEIEEFFTSQFSATPAAVTPSEADA